MFIGSYSALCVIIASIFSMRGFIQKHGAPASLPLAMPTTTHCENILPDDRCRTFVLSKKNPTINPALLKKALKNQT